MAIAIQNLFHIEPTISSSEQVRALLSTGAVRVEQIVSHGHSSPEGFWYDQEHAEWVMLLNGSATLMMEGEGVVQLTGGDYLLIPAHIRHRVEAVSADAVWLAVHFQESSEQGRLAT